MAVRPVIRVDARRILEDAVLVVRERTGFEVVFTHEREFRLRWTLFFLIMRLGTWVLGIGYEVERADGLGEVFDIWKEDG